MALELFRPKPSVPRDLSASAPSKPARAEAVAPIAWSDRGTHEPDSTWATLPPAVRDLAAQQGLAPPAGDSPSSHVARHDNETLAWWVDVRTGTITLARSLVGGAPVLRRYHPGDPGVVFRRAILPAVPVASAPPGTSQGGRGRAPQSSWRDDALWQNLPIEARRQLDETFTDSEPLADGEATIMSTSRGARETIRLTLLSWTTVAGVGATRTVPEHHEDLVVAGRALQDLPWDVIFFSAPVVTPSAPIAASQGHSALGPGRRQGTT